MKNLQTLKSEKEKVEKEIDRIERKVTWAKKQHCDNCEPNEMCDICKEQFKEMHKGKKFHKAKLSALNLGIQAVENTIKDEMNYLNEIRILNSSQGLISWAGQERYFKLKSQLQKQKENTK